MQLAPVAALAARWRRLELASWRGLLRRTTARHAAGAHRSWFHLCAMLSAKALTAEGAASGGAAGGGPAVRPEDAAAALARSGVPVLQGLASVPSVIETAAVAAAGTAGDGASARLTLDQVRVRNAQVRPPRVACDVRQGRIRGVAGCKAGTEAGTEAPEPAPLPALMCCQEAEYRRLASALEAFVQTSTLGEFRERLALLAAFAAHARVALAAAARGGALVAPPLAAVLAAALSNLLAYYGQFAGVVDAAVTATLAPLEKDLQVSRPRGGWRPLPSQGVLAAQDCDAGDCDCDAYKPLLVGPYGPEGSKSIAQSSDAGAVSPCAGP